NITCDDKLKEQLLQNFMEHEQKKCADKIAFLTKEKYDSNVYRMNNGNMQYLTSDTCKEDIFYQDRPGLYLKCILEEYATLPYIKREKIFYKKTYDIVENAIESHKLLKVQTLGKRQFHVYPYKLIEDSLSTRCYLACYSKEPSKTGNEKKPASFRIPRLSDIRIMKESGHLTKTEIKQLEQTIADRSIQFLVGEEDEIRVYLTDEGIRKYQEQIYLRPPKDPVASTRNEYVFHCTQTQAEYYFFKFGADAKILSPQCLQEKFSQMYLEAAKHYDGQ
ncbi:MAG: WYL domain-containing protein, partial [Lachnospiraceae bacterium]|nr:WYL domain-containing protein [Lachnospiraceae bacterium]